jgi:hypothetical protein
MMEFINYDYIITKINFKIKFNSIKQHYLQIFATVLLSQNLIFIFKNS